MKTLVCTCISIMMFINLSAQTSNGLFGKNRNKRDKVDTEAPYISDEAVDERTRYFTKEILPTNDTIKIAQFLATGINPNSKLGSQTTILAQSARWHNIETVKCLLDHGADPNLRLKKINKPILGGASYAEYSEYPLVAAAGSNEVAKMELLIKYGADINRCLDEVKRVATEKGNTQMMMYIEQLTGTNAIMPNVLAVMTERSFEHDASKVTPELVRELVKRGADVNAYSNRGKTALLNTIQNPQVSNRLVLAKELIDHGANVNQCDKEDPTYPGVHKFYPTSPLKAAIRTNNLPMVKLLVENGADVNNGELLRSSQSKEVTEYLIMHGAK